MVWLVISVPVGGLTQMGARVYADILVTMHGPFYAWDRAELD